MRWHLEAAAVVGNSEGVGVQRGEGHGRGTKGDDRTSREEESSPYGWSEREGQTLKRNLKRGWYSGSENFREKPLGLLEGRIGGVGNRNYRSSEQNKAHGEVPPISWTGGAQSFQKRL